MRSYLFFIFLFGFSQHLLAESINYDSLLIVAQSTDDRDVFRSIEETIRSEENEYSLPAAIELIVYCSSRTKVLNYEFLHGEFKFQESTIHVYHGNIGAGMKMAQEALTIFSKYHTLEAARSYKTMGSMTAGLGDYKTALEYLKKADLICERFKDAPRYAYMR